MQRTLIVLLLAFLISSPFTQRASSQPERSVDQQRASTPLEQAAKSKLLFFRLPALDSVEGPQKLEFRVRVDGLPYLVEQISISPDEARLSPTIELLSKEPAQLKRLYRLAKKGAHQVEVTVMLNGQIAKEFSFDELLSYNRDLKQDLSFRPIPVESRVLVLGLAQDKRERSAIELQTATCEQECDIQYSACAEAYCGSPTVFCSPCLEERSLCLEACPPPPPPNSCPSTTCSSANQLIGASWYGTQCLTNVFQQKRLFDLYLLHYKRTTTCRTVDPCAGTDTTSTSYSYFDRWCDQDTGIPCHSSFGSAFTCF
ncbi:MAG TPA: hypothetical protein VF131_00475 [Blastocatellia bacterium]|nr:hypothetical protein [Blastocatellia bacterium]